MKKFFRWGLLLAIGIAMAAGAPMSGMTSDYAATVQPGQMTKDPFSSSKLSEDAVEAFLKAFYEDKQETVRVIVQLRDPGASKKQSPPNVPVKKSETASTGPVRSGFDDPKVRDQVAKEVEAAISNTETQLQLQQEKTLDGAAEAIRITNRFTYIFGFSAEVTEAGLGILADHPDVISIVEDQILKPHLAQGIPLMSATVPRNTYSGAGMAIAIIDTGIDYMHPRLGGAALATNTKVIGGWDCGDDDADPMDCQGHGTCCAGLAAGDLGTTGDYIGGVAHSAKLYGVKISPGCEGWAYTSDMVEGWEWCVTHQNDDPSNPIMIMSTSFGGGQFSNQGDCDAYVPAMTTAAANAKAAGITLFVSTGNNGWCGSTGWPGCLSDVIGVGAVYDADIGPKYWSVCTDLTTAADKVTCYSNSASFMGVFAPSNDAYTTDITGAGGYSGGDYYSAFGGTSAACPYAAGAAACLQSAALDIAGAYLTPAQLETNLATTGDPVTDAGKCASVTKPRVNLENAVAALSAPPPAGCNILYAPSEGDDPVFRAAVAAITGGAVDYYDARSGTPSLSTLEQYCCVYTWANYSYANRTAFGDVLADFVDQGGTVVLGSFAAYTSGNSLGGRIMTADYCPVTGGFNHFSNSQYAGDGATAIHEGVTAYGCIYRDILTLQGDGIQDGSYNDGEIAHAYRPDFKVIYSNGSGAVPMNGTGDWPLLIANSCAAGEPERLFGTVNMGGSPSDLVELDPDTGALIRTIGPVGYSVNGLAWDRTTRKLYGSSANNDPYTGLLEIDMTTGAGTPIGVSGWGLDGWPVVAITADAAGQLYGWWEPIQDDLVTIDKSTGVATRVGESGGLNTATLGLDFNGSGILYLVNGSGDYYIINTATGAASYQGVITTAHHGKFRPSTDIWYGINTSQSGPKSLVLADLSTGTVTGTLPTVDNLHTLAFIGGSGGAVPCTFAIAPDDVVVGYCSGASGNTVEVAVTASGPSCAWTVVNDLPWVSVNPMSGNGSGTVTVSLAANDGYSRSGAITIAGQTFSIEQLSNFDFNGDGCFLYDDYRYYLINFQKNRNKPASAFPELDLNCDGWINDKDLIIFHNLVRKYYGKCQQQPS